MKDIVEALKDINNQKHEFASEGPNDGSNLENFIIGLLSNFLKSPLKKLTSMFTTKKKLAEVRDYIRANDVSFLPDCIIKQPFGWTKFPDILVIKDGKGFFIECKSSKDGKYDFGDNGVKDSCCYVLTNKNRNMVLIGNVIDHPKKHPYVQERLDRIQNCQDAMEIQEYLEKTVFFIGNIPTWFSFRLREVFKTGNIA